MLPITKNLDQAKPLGQSKPVESKGQLRKGYHLMGAELQSGLLEGFWRWTVGMVGRCSGCTQCR